MPSGLTHYLYILHFLSLSSLALPNLWDMLVVRVHVGGGWRYSSSPLRLPDESHVFIPHASTLLYCLLSSILNPSCIPARAFSACTVNRHLSRSFPCTWDFIFLLYTLHVQTSWVWDLYKIPTFRYISKSKGQIKTYIYLICVLLFFSKIRNISLKVSFSIFRDHSVNNVLV